MANNIQLLRKDSSPVFTGQDVSKIRKFSRQKNVVSFLSVPQVQFLLIFLHHDGYCHCFHFRTVKNITHLAGGYAGLIQSLECRPFRLLCWC